MTSTLFARGLLQGRCLDERFAHESSYSSLGDDIAKRPTGMSRAMGTFHVQVRMGLGFVQFALLMVSKWLSRAFYFSCIVSEIGCACTGVLDAELRASPVSNFK